MKEFGLWAYRGAVIALLLYCSLRLDAIARYMPGTAILEAQVRELIRAVDRLKP